ncbi:vascular endothelial growth factor receptor kdr-like isoform X1 [Trichogramma pretiosum]|uniref:vascular endothelial growth factor receptor kdr-like isoform X1 n=2 Tax=Trichogramma pretiosum TaxID=7493 RepID=UPI0006C9B006|nr:vascular endothelial growth factor receptor kdr-like isoform X1 [Trichogramma pretiosum]
MNSEEKRPRQRQLLLLLLGLTLTFSIPTVCEAHKPVIHPNVPEMIINEHESLEIVCTATYEMDFHYPEEDDTLKTSIQHEGRPVFNEADGTNTIKFIRPSVRYGDTGWYGCAHTKMQFDRWHRDYNDPNASWIYVYVRSNDTVFVHEEMDVLTPIFAPANEPLHLPCRPTLPHYHVDLSINDRDITMDENVKFDPKVGFIVKNLSAEDTGTFVCSIRKDDGEVATYEGTIIVTTPTGLKKPEILSSGLEHVTKGSRLSVKCQIVIGTDLRYEFHWVTPRTSASRMIVDPVEIFEGNHNKLVISELIENNVTEDDDGEYICRVVTRKETVETQRYINVHDPSHTFLRLKYTDSREFNVKTYQPVSFTIEVEAYPEPVITWFTPDGKNASTLQRIQVTNSGSMTSLKIPSVQIEDMGTYHVQAYNDQQTKTLNFTLNVLAKPWAVIGHSVKPYYVIDEPAEFYCNVVGNPLPEISWYYTKCPHYPQLVDCERDQLETEIVDDRNPPRVDAKTELRVSQSGLINCTACNEYGCDSALQDVLVSDTDLRNNAFTILEPEDNVTIGDELRVTCVASSYNFSSVEWLDANNHPLVQSAKLRLTFEDSAYTHRSHLTLANLTYADEAEFHCRALTPDNEAEYTVYHLRVSEPSAPRFKSVNMNGTETVVSAKEAHKVRYLICRVDGLPVPQVTWFKDGKPLKINDQFSLDQDNQTLTIKYLMEKNSGKYSCIAQNRFGQVEQFQTFMVKGPRVSLAWIIAIVILVLLLIGLMTYFCIKIKKEKTMRKQLMEDGLIYFEEGALDCINPELTIDDQAELLPYDRKFEFPRSNLKLGKQLGSGAFGVVIKAQARGILPEESVSTVAVKMVRRNAEPAYIRALASELKIMVHLGKHLNVVNLLGACTNNIAKRELLVIVEYCRYGNLHNYLLKHRDDFIDQIDPNTGDIDPDIGYDIICNARSSTRNSKVKYAALSFARSVSGQSANQQTTASTTLMTTSGGNRTGYSEAVTYVADTEDVAGIGGGNVNDGLVDSVGSQQQQPEWSTNYQGDYKERNVKPICTQDLLLWAFQVARGMEYLCKRKVLHGDLAARNILLAENNVVKICDFGLAKSMYKDENYQKKSDGPVPIKWMAIESIRDRVFSTQSDIWSFGIVLWEFFSLAETPYPGMQAEKQYQKLIEGYRMERPKYATEDVYSIMKRCWRSKPVLRPSFSELVDSLGDLMDERIKQEYIEMNSPYMDLNATNQEDNKDYLTMMASPDHSLLASPNHDYVNCPNVLSDAPTTRSPSDDTSGVFGSPRGDASSSSSPYNPRFDFPNTSSSRHNTTTNSHSDNEEAAPMLRKVEDPEEELDADNYLKPIDVKKKRENFVKQQEEEKSRERTAYDRDSGYCNTPKNFELVDVKVHELRPQPAQRRQQQQQQPQQHYRNLDEIDMPGVIIHTQDNYVNMPQQKTDFLKDSSVDKNFLNPSYIWAEARKTDILE